MQQKKQTISPLKQRILQFVKEIKISQRDFYYKTGVSRGTLTNDSGISEDTLSKIFATYPELNREWVLTGVGKMQAQNASLSASQNASLSKEEGATSEIFPTDAGKGCINCKKLEGEIFILRDLLRARDLTVTQKEDEINKLNRELGRLEAENAQLKGENTSSNKQSRSAS